MENWIAPIIGCSIAWIGGLFIGLLFRRPKVTYVIDLETVGFYSMSFEEMIDFGRPKTVNGGDDVS